MDKNIIPKIIHCVWLSGEEKPQLIKDCIASWRSTMPDFEIKEWGMEDIKDIASFFLKDAINARKWAFATDFLRVYILYHYGGIYMDMDVYVYRSLSPFLVHKAFSGIEFWPGLYCSTIKKKKIGGIGIDAAIMGAVKGHKWIGDILSYYDNKTFIFMPYDDDGNYKWGFYLAPIDSIKETDNIFKSLYFERIWLPDFVTGTPEEEYSNLSRKIEKMEEKKSIAVECRSRMISEKGELVNKYFCRIKYLYDLFEMRRNVTVYKEKFYMTGFVPKKCIEEFKKLFDSINTVSLVIKPAGEGNIEKTPVKLKNNSFSKPFSMFVEMYGLPSYDGFNPTMLVAVTYTLLFGIMFGDLGQGLVISLVGYFVYRKKGNLLGAILQRVGLSSAFFGLVYGSVFGFEHALDPLYKSMGLKHKPLEIMDNTMVILLGAIVIGIVIILISIIINIFISLKHRDYSEALFGNNGIAGLILFSSLLAGVAVMMIGNGSLFTAPYVICLIVIPLVIMFFREPLGCLVSGKKFKLESGIGDFIASNFFEVFEFILGYATNTLSFVRIGGFIFSHAGMMSVVMLLSESVSAGASPVVVVIGNIFVMGMEGLIVGIQVLRLEFYEVFSRFYDGDGQPFEPVKINYDKNID